MGKYYNIALLLVLAFNVSAYAGERYKGYDVKQAEYYDFGAGATVTFVQKNENGQVKMAGNKPLTVQKRVLWITKAVRQSVPVAEGGDGVKEEVYIYQLESGAVWHTVAAHWKDPVAEPAVLVEPLERSANGRWIDKSGKFDSSGNVISKIVPNSRCGDIVAIDGALLPTPPKMRVEVFCRCDGEIKDRRWVQVMMDGQEHYWPDDK